MLVALALLGLIVLVLVALALGVPKFLLLATAFVLLASVLALILSLRGQETAKPGDPGNIGLPGERPPAETPTPPTRSGRRTITPYVLWALAALTLALGVCGVGVFSQDDDADVALPAITSAPASTVALAEAGGPFLAPTVTPVEPLPSPIPIPTATPATDPVPDEPKRCPPGHRKQGRC